jgi:hypothetical protein
MNPLSGIRFGAEIAGAARAHGLDPALLAAVAAQETGGPGARSGRNVVGDGGHGRGLFQIDDRYHAFARSDAAMDPASNAGYAASLLAGLLAKFGGNVRSALSAYNAGAPQASGTRTTWPDGTTLGYADSVLRHGDEITGGAAPPAESPIPAPAPATSFAPLGAPAGVVVPQWTPPPWQFRSFETEQQNGGGAATSAEKTMAALVDPAQTETDA